MTTPVTVNAAWTLVYDGATSGAFDGTAQNVGGAPVIARITTDGAPAEGVGGVMILGQPAPIKVSALQALYCRAYGVAETKGSVVLF